MPTKRKVKRPTGIKVYGIKSKKRPIMLGGARPMYHHHHQHGYGFFDSVGNFFKRAYNVVKNNKLISRVGSLIPHPAVQAAARVAGQLGLGRAGAGLSF